MPRPLADYELSDWLRLRPVMHRLKQARYDAITAIYVRRPVRRGELAALRQELAGHRVMVAVAYEDPTVVEWQSRLLRRFVPEPIYVVADNSRDDALAGQIEAVAARERRPYLRLPANPWSGRAASRSHGLALNWLWRNLVRPAAPDAFGFLDDDLFPTEPDDPFGRLSRQDIYGDVRRAGERWFLWAGYCFFRFAAVRDRPLDFGQDWFLGMDTGGANWWPLYRTIDRNSIELRQYGSEPVSSTTPSSEAIFTRHGTWLHEYGTGRDPHAKKRQALAARLAPLLDRP